MTERDDETLTVASLFGEPLPDADNVPDFPDTPQGEAHPDYVGGQTPPKPPLTCEACGEILVRKPGSRGRPPRFHDDCKPVPASRNPSRTALNKAEREADVIAQMVRAKLMQGALVVSMVDPFDGYAIVAGSKGVVDNVRTVLATHDAWRQELLRMQNGGSLVGLIGACLMIALPIAAHHGLIPSARVASFMEQVPKTLLDMQKKLAEAEVNLAEQMQAAAQTAPAPASAAA